MGHRSRRRGAHGSYGVRHYKTHAKILLIVRRSGVGCEAIRTQATAQLQRRTARHYTDFGLMTVVPDGRGCLGVLQCLTGFSRPRA